MSQATTVLVTAATEFTAGATVEEFLARGRHVRALPHRDDARSIEVDGAMSSTANVIDATGLRSN